MISDYELAKYISNNLKAYLSEEDQDVSCRIVEMPKNNQGFIVGVKIDIPGIDHAPIVYMKSVQAALADGYDREAVMEGFVTLVEKAKSELIPQQFFPEDYQRIKQFTSVMLVNTEANKDMLKYLPHKEIEDLSAICYIDLPEDPSLGKGIIKVNDELLSKWGITKDELFDVALNNDIASKKATLQNVEALILHGDNTNYLAPSVTAHVNKSNPANSLYILSNETKVFGASVIVSTDILDRISDIFPEGFCMIPSSIHEILIVPDTDAGMRKEMGNIVRSVNMTSCVSKDEVLSDRIYTYDRDSKTIHQVKESLPEKNVQPRFHQNGFSNEQEIKPIELEHDKNHDIKLN